MDFDLEFDFFFLGKKFAILIIYLFIFKMVLLTQQSA